MDNEDAKNREIRQLVELNQTLHTMREAQKSHQLAMLRVDLIDQSPEIDRSSSGPIVVAGHRLKHARAGMGRKKRCEVCQKSIRTTRSDYRCSECAVYLHSSPVCVTRMHRACPASNIGHPCRSVSMAMGEGAGLYIWYGGLLRVMGLWDGFGGG